jgi:hypothetical protein
MADELAVLGIATTSRNGTLTVYRVIVRAPGDGTVEVEPLASWQSTRRDEVRSISDLVDALGNILDRKRNGAPDALAAKRAESTQGRPSSAYDQKIRAEAAAMVAAASQGRRYFAYRTNQLGDGRELVEAASQAEAYPSEKEEKEAVAAACTALAQLRNEDETGS